MKHRVYVIASEYSAPLGLLSRTSRAEYRQLLESPAPGDSPRRGGAEAPGESPVSPWQRLFFSAPAEGESWADLGAGEPPSLGDLLASAAHRALASLHDLCGHADYTVTCRSISDLVVASMPLLGSTPDTNLNPGLIPLMLRAALGLGFDCHSQFVAGTADSGASGFASAVRIAQSRPATVLVTAGQIIPSGYTGQYRIRSVFTLDEQRQGLDMMAIGDVLMDALRRTHAGPGFDVGDVQAWLARVRHCKLEGARAYPAALGVRGGNPASTDRFVTRYFRSADVAKAGCGAAAVVLTSDPELLIKVRRYAKARARGRGKRFRNTPVVEVVGVGEGTTNPRVLQRRSPLVSLSSIRQALASAADDAALPISVYPDSAFAVLHDAFPSMELAFLLAVGLDWQRASLRMTTWWSNPYGGLLSFGDAIGASGLVQICKAFHVFTGDRRYIRPSLNPIRRFRREGSYAFTSAIGGPLSHIVVSILRGGVPPTARDQTAFFDRAVGPELPRSLVRDEIRRRRQWHRAAEIYIDRLVRHSDDLFLIEGVTEIDPRSCAQAVGADAIDGLVLERLGDVVRDVEIDRCRGEILELLRQLKANYLSTEDHRGVRWAREDYDAGLAALVAAWQARGALRPKDGLQDHSTDGPEGGDGDAAAAGDDPAGDSQSEDPELARELHRYLKALKQCIRIPMVMLVDSERGTRQMSFLPDLRAIDDADFVRMQDDRFLDFAADSASLPWWNSRATRSDRAIVLPGVRTGKSAEPSSAVSGARGPNPDRVFDALVAPERRLTDERHAELVFLRAYFAPAGPQAAVDLAMRDLGLAPEVDPELRSGKQVPAIFYKNDIIGSSVIDDVHEAYELLGRAVQRARGWFGMYASTCAQHGDSVSLVSLDRRLERTSGEAQGDAEHARTEAISNASRFARDVAEWCLGYGIRLRTVVSFGHGMPYRDVNDERSVASDSAIRGARLLDHVAEKAHDHGFAALPWIAFDLSELGDIHDAVELFEHELLAASGPDWRVPDGPSSPVALERWDDIRFTVWYRPDGD